MHVEVHKINVDAVSQEANRIRASSASGGEGRDISRYKLAIGDNILRILPPYNVRGFVFKSVYTHFNIPPDNSIYSCMRTWKEKFDNCLMCQALDKIQSLFPDVELWRQRSGVYYHCNVIVRDQEEKGVQICAFPPSVYNWVILQLDDPTTRDMTDYERGFDIKVTKTIKKTQSGDRTSYATNFVPDRRPLHTKENIVAMWLSSLWDLDRIVKPVSDDQLAEMQQAAGTMLTYYQRRQREGLVPGVATLPDHTTPGQPELASQAPQTAVPVQQTEALPVSDSGVAESLAELDPQELPPCHASFDSPQPLEDGTIGFKPTIEKCLLCPFETACMEAKAAKGL